MQLISMSKHPFYVLLNTILTKPKDYRVKDDQKKSTILCSAPYDVEDR